MKTNTNYCPEWARNDYENFVSTIKLFLMLFLVLGIFVQNINAQTPPTCVQMVVVPAIICPNSQTTATATVFDVNPAGESVTWTINPNASGAFFVQNGLTTFTQTITADGNYSLLIDSGPIPNSINGGFTVQLGFNNHPGVQTCSASPLVIQPICNITGDDNVCPGTTHIYTSGVTGGFGTTSHFWTVVSGGATINGLNTNATVSVTVPSTCGTFTLRDVVTRNGCQSSCEQTFTVRSSNPVIANCPTGGALGCNPTPPSCSQNVTASDICGVVPVICTPGPLIVNGCNRSQTFTYTATNVCGLSATPCEVSYTWIVDLVAPVITAIGTPTDGVLGCNPDAATIDAALGTASATDNCGPVTAVPSDGAVISDGCNRSQTRTWTSVDACGNQAIPVSRTATWTVATAPVFANCGQTIALGQNPQILPTCATIADGTVLFGGTVTASNECGPVPVSCEPSTITVNGCSLSQVFTFTATACGLTTTCTRTFTWTNCVSIGDFVWNDINNNGIQDGGETGVADVTVTLYKCSDDTVVGVPVTTLADGKYLFEGLVPGDYYVGFSTLPSGYFFSPKDMVGDDAKDSDVNPSTGKTGCETLIAGENNTTYDAGLFNPSSIGNFVWDDINNNGIQDIGENGIQDVNVTLYTCGDILVAGPIPTAADGSYNFTGLVPGSYYVKFSNLPSGYIFTVKDASGNTLDATDSDADTTTGKTVCETLDSGEKNDTYDAGFFKPGSIGDFVWNDLNHNGIQDTGEPGIAGATVALSGCAISMTTTTDADGHYLFPGLLACSTYVVSFTTPIGFTNSSPADQGGDDAKDSDPNSPSVNVALGYGENNRTIDAGFYNPLGSIGDFVWNDTGTGIGDGIQALGEPGIAGVTVKLTGPVSATATTDGTGHYLFPDLPAGTYCVTFPVLDGFAITTANTPNDALDSDQTTEGFPVCGIVLALGENRTDIDAGYVAEDCWESCDANSNVSAIKSITKDIGAGTITIRVTFNDKFADNTYGTNAIGWPSGHTFANLTGSDHLQMALLNKTNQKQLEFKIDYISTDASKPSGYGTLGVAGGDGGMVYGVAAGNIVGTKTSIAENFNTYGYVLTTNSPATDANYTPNPTYPNWIYPVWYEVTFKTGTAAFPTADDFGSVLITNIHASPSKIGVNSPCVQPCAPLLAVTTVNNGPCATTCEGTASVTASHGKPPYTYLWTGGVIKPGQEDDTNLTGLCAGTYSVTVTDASGATTNAQAVLVDPATTCPPEICYESCTGNPAVGATQTVTDNGSTVTIRTTFARTFADNSYGIYANGWPSGHTFGNLTGSDKLQLALYDKCNVKRMDFAIDYISASTSVSSGYKSLGVAGGDGSITVGSASDIVSWNTSMDYNFNVLNHAFTVNSPQTSPVQSYNVVNPTEADWVYDVWYEVTVKKSAFTCANGDFDHPYIALIHASPSKTGNNTECLQLCLPVSVSAKGNNGACGSVGCVGSITATAAHGKPPYTYTIIPGGTVVGPQAGPATFTGLCANDYTVTVTDFNGVSASSSVVHISAAQQEPCDICYESCTGNPLVSATQTVHNNGNGTTTIRTTFAKTFVDNTYGTNAIGWDGCGGKKDKSGHKFSDLTGSDKLQLALYDGTSTTKVMEFKIDYITASGSGYQTLGVSGGDGGWISGSVPGILSNFKTSLSENFNTLGYVLTTNSPATNASYVPNAAYPNWIYDVWYEVTVKTGAGTPFSSGVVRPLITSVHASPSKTCNNTECVKPCGSALSVSSAVSFEAYPVPFKDELTIKYKFDYSSDVKIELIDSQGITVFTENDTNSYSDKEVSLKFRFKREKEKVYFVRVTTDQGSSTKEVLSSSK